MVFALMAVMAVRARNEAQLQRVQAEGLIEFMLGDLRKKLEPVGRLEVLDSVGEKALAYYGSQDADRLDATALGHRSRAMHLIGEIRDLRGSPAEAQAAFEQAASTTAQLLAQAPNDGQRIFDHAQSVFWVGYAAWKRADGKTAEANFQEYLELSQRLVKIDPDQVDWQAEVAFAYVNLGMVQLGTGRPAVALQSLRLAGDGLHKLVPTRPDLSFELAHNHGWQAKAFEMLGDYEQALAAQQRKLALFQAMPGGERNKTAQRGTLNALNEISQYELALGGASTAETAALASLQIAEALIQEDPKNLLWRGDACLARLRLVEIQLAQAHRADAQAQLARASGCAVQYNAVGSLGLSYAIRLGSRVLSLSAALVTKEKRPVLAVEIEKFLDQTFPKLTPDTPDRAKLVVELANVAVALGELQAQRDEPAARAAWRLAEAQLQPFADMADGAVLTPLARARFYLGDAQGAQALVARIQRSSYRHPAYANLVKQLQSARGGADSHKPQE
jgi:tetratricopeptide (TPR) repeat protein